MGGLRCGAGPRHAPAESHKAPSSTGTTHACDRQTSSRGCLPLQGSEGGERTQAFDQFHAEVVRAHCSLHSPVAYCTRHSHRLRACALIRPTQTHSRESAWRPHWCCAPRGTPLDDTGMIIRMYYIHCETTANPNRTHALQRPTIPNVRCTV